MATTAVAVNPAATFPIRFEDMRKLFAFVNRVRDIAEECDEINHILYLLGGIDTEDEAVCPPGTRRSTRTTTRGPSAAAA